MSYIFLYTRSAVGNKRIYELHSHDCGMGIVRAEQIRNEWIAKWPNYCESCGASSVMYSKPDNLAPWGSKAVWLRDVTDPCPDCVATKNIQDMKCPRCGKEIFDKLIETVEIPEGSRWLIEEFGQYSKIEYWLIDDHAKCPECGWNQGFGKDDYLPPGGVCYCIVEDLYFNEIDTSMQPSLFQRVLFHLFGEPSQDRFDMPIVRVPDRIDQ